MTGRFFHFLYNIFIITIERGMGIFAFFTGVLCSPKLGILFIIVVLKVSKVTSSPMLGLLLLLAILPCLPIQKSPLYAALTQGDLESQCYEPSHTLLQSEMSLLTNRIESFSGRAGIQVRARDCML